jgi:hypothetical protein
MWKVCQCEGRAEIGVWQLDADNDIEDKSNSGQQETAQEQLQWLDKRKWQEESPKRLRLLSLPYGITTKKSVFCIRSVCFEDYTVGFWGFRRCGENCYLHFPGRMEWLEGTKQTGSNHKCQQFLLVLYSVNRKEESN